MFAVSGVLAAGRKGLDVLGVAVIAVVTAIGGGTLRDLLLDRHPIFWIANTAYLWVILAATAVTLGYVRFWAASRRTLLVADALGLAFFTIGGVDIAQQTGQADLIALLMGTMTGVAGGVLRDVLLGEIPLIFRPGRLYATAAIVGAGLYVLLEGRGVPQGNGGACRHGHHCRTASGRDLLATRITGRTGPGRPDLLRSRVPRSGGENDRSER